MMKAARNDPAITEDGEFSFIQQLRSLAPPDTAITVGEDAGSIVVLEPSAADPAEVRVQHPREATG